MLPDNFPPWCIKEEEIREVARNITLEGEGKPNKWAIKIQTQFTKSNMTQSVDGTWGMLGTSAIREPPHTNRWQSLGRRVQIFKEWQENALLWFMNLYTPFGLPQHTSLKETPTMFSRDCCFPCNSYVFLKGHILSMTLQKFGCMKSYTNRFHNSNFEATLPQFSVIGSK